MEVLLIVLAPLLLAVGVVGAAGLLLLELLSRLEQMVQSWLRDEHDGTAVRIGVGDGW